MSHIKTDRQVEIILFKRTKAGIHFLMLKRSPQKGGFWQPITGGVHEGETNIEAAIREVNEETGIEAKRSLIDTGYSFSFEAGDNTLHEHVYGLEVEEHSPITLSAEHTEFVWTTLQEALDRYLKWPNNKCGLEALVNIIETD